MTAVKVAVPVVALQVEAVLRELAASLRHVVQQMRPGINELSRQPAPLAHFQDRLERIVVRVPGSLEFVNQAKVGELRRERQSSSAARCAAQSRLINVSQG